MASKNLFNPVFRLNSTFYNVSGLQVGNTIRFSGINVGTVDDISIINDSMVRVEMLIRKEVQKFIKEDCKVKIGSEGLIGPFASDYSRQCKFCTGKRRSAT
ncbi:MAG: MCE family protein [Bacteroidetes bacterium]|nr:MCE family protein [Bacteroidota bacterium]